ncbi:MAG: hypothetical protein E6Q97_24195 [Desulfurellales bacterium]|nr:MAG: hypothetical protein E6Q97_24195 [Desulfurellales bacterium]
MAPPFKLQSPPGDPGIRRGDNGRFVPAAPPQIVREASNTGTNTIDLIREKYSSPEHPTPGSRRGIADEHPWPPATPPAKTPFVIRGS